MSTMEKLALIADDIELVGNLECIDIGDKSYYRHIKTKETIGPYIKGKSGRIMRNYLWFMEDTGIVIDTPKGINIIKCNKNTGYKQAMLDNFIEVMKILTEQVGIENIQSEKDDYIHITINKDNTREHIYFVRLVIGDKISKNIVWDTQKYRDCKEELFSYFV